jgi:hypothetical protein
MSTASLTCMTTEASPPVSPQRPESLSGSVPLWCSPGLPDRTTTTTGPRFASRLSVPETQVHIPDVIEPDEKLPQDLVALRKFALLMDGAIAIPGTKMRFGLDAVIGLIPGIGDMVGGLMSTWIIAGALRHRVPGRIIARMVLNVAIDLFFGAVPVAGDVFDFFYEENMKNMRLLEKYRDRKRPPRSAGEITLVFLLIFSFLAILALALLGSVVGLIIWLIGQRSWG